MLNECGYKRPQPDTQLVITGVAHPLPLALCLIKSLAKFGRGREENKRSPSACMRPALCWGVSIFPHSVLTVSPHLGPGVVKGLPHRGQSLQEQAFQGVKLASPSTAAPLPREVVGLWGRAAEDTRALPCSCLGQVSEMQKLDAQVKELVLKSAVEAERLVAGKLKKDTYIENEKLISGKRQELVTKIDHILDAL